MNAPSEAGFHDHPVSQISRSMTSQGPPPNQLVDDVTRSIRYCPFPKEPKPFGAHNALKNGRKRLGFEHRCERRFSRVRKNIVCNVRGWAGRGKEPFNPLYRPLQPTLSYRLSSFLAIDTNSFCLCSSVCRPKVSSWIPTFTS